MLELEQCKDYVGGRVGGGALSCLRGGGVHRDVTLGAGVHSSPIQTTAESALGKDHLSV